jgi:hypothetical protein
MSLSGTRTDRGEKRDEIEIEIEKEEEEKKEELMRSWPESSRLPDADVCCVCLSIPNERGRVESCSHVFCFECILAWSKVETRCPLCKSRFRWIEREEVCIALARDDASAREKPIYCKEKNQNERNDDDEHVFTDADAIFCVICDRGDDERNLLLCDGCDEGYHCNCVGLTRVPRGRWHCPECASNELVEERDNNARLRQEQTITRRRTIAVSPRRAERARIPGTMTTNAMGSNRNENRIGMLEALVTQPSTNHVGDAEVRENALMANALNENSTHRENRLMRERRRANRMRNGEVQLSGGGGGSSAHNRGDSFRRRQIAIVQELRDAWERLMKEEQDFPNFDEVEMLHSRRRSSREENVVVVPAASDDDVESAWKLMDAARAAELKERVAVKKKTMKKENDDGERAIARVTTGRVKRPKIRVRTSDEQVSPNNDKVAFLEELPSFLRDAFENKNKEEEKKDISAAGTETAVVPKVNVSIPGIDVDRCASEIGKDFLLLAYRDKRITKDEYKKTIRSIVRKANEAHARMMKLNLQLCITDLERIARAEVDVLSSRTNQ